MEEKNEAVKPIVIPSYSDQDKKKENTVLERFRKKYRERKVSKEERKKEKRKETMLRQTPSILPHTKNNDDFINLKNGVMDIFQITSKDLYSKSDVELEYIILARATLLRSYYNNFKEISLNFPANTEKQKAYWTKKKQATEDPIRLRFIERKIFELEFLEKERTNREYFLFIYAESEQQLEDLKKQMIRSMKQTFPLKSLSVDKKNDVLFMLNNQNTKL